MSQSVLITSLVDEIKPHFQAQEDVATIQSIKALSDKAKGSLEKQQQLIKDLIKGLSDATSTLREDVERAERGEEEMRQLQQAIEDRENVMLQLQAMEGQGELTEHKMQEIEAQKRDLVEQLAGLKSSKLVEIPAIRHALTLYANITNLRWNYDAPLDVVRGFIALDDDVRHFDIAEKDSVRVADQLWGMM